MRQSATILLMIFNLGLLQAQDIDTFFLKYGVSKVDKRLKINTGLPHSNLSGKPFLGEAPPGNTPKIFPLAVSPGFFAAERIAISGDGREIYYSEIKQSIVIEKTGRKLFE